MVWPFGNSYEEKVRFYIVIIVAFVVFFPVIPAFFAYESRELKWNAHFARDLALLGIIIGIASLLALRHRHKHQWSELARELVFIFWQGKYACFLGGAVGLVAASIYLILPFDAQNDEFAERAASAFAIYIGTVGSILGIHTLYRKSAPITNVELFLESLCNDLEEYGRPGNHLLIVYPALNIGLYRTLKQYHYSSVNSIPENHPYSRFYTLVIKAAKKLGNGARVITYPKELYSDLFKQYDTSQELTSPDLAQECAVEARRFVDTVSTNAGNESHIEVHPHKCPPHVVVIGPVSYSILSYGLPRFREDEEGKRFESSEDGLATLLVYRREDSALANLILREVNEEVRRIRQQN